MGSVMDKYCYGDDEHCNVCPYCTGERAGRGKQRKDSGRRLFASSAVSFARLGRDEKVSDAENSNHADDESDDGRNSATTITQKIGVLKRHSEDSTATPS